MTTFRDRSPQGGSRTRGRGAMPRCWRECSSRQESWSLWTPELCRLCVSQFWKQWTSWHGSLTFTEGKRLCTTQKNTRFEPRARLHRKKHFSYLNLSVNNDSQWLCPSFSGFLRPFDIYLHLSYDVKEIKLFLSLIVRNKSINEERNERRVPDMGEILTKTQSGKDGRLRQRPCQSTPSFGQFGTSLPVNKQLLLVKRVYSLITLNFFLFLLV